MFLVENADVLRHQAAEWIKREPADRSFHAALVQFANNQRAPGAAETARSEVPTAACECAEREYGEKTADTDNDSACHSRMFALNWRGGFARFENGWHCWQIEKLKRPKLRGNIDVTIYRFNVLTL